MRRRIRGEFQLIRLGFFDWPDFRQCRARDQHVPPELQRVLFGEPQHTKLTLLAEDEHPHLGT